MCYIRIVNFILVMLMLLGSYYLEYVQHVMPCLLCLLQRYICYLLIVFFSVEFFVLRVRALRIAINVGAFLSGFGGLALALRQIWLQYVSTQSNETCLPNPHFILTHFPLSQVWRLMVSSNSECGREIYHLWGMPLSVISAIVFVYFVCSTIFLIVD